MNLWRHLSRRFAKGFGRGAAAYRDLATSYRAHFAGSGGRDEAEIVLADLANFTGFYRVNGPEIDPVQRAYSDGMRAVYGRVFRFLRMSDEEVRQLEEAARAEALVDAEEGQF